MGLCVVRERRWAWRGNDTWWRPSRCGGRERGQQRTALRSQWDWRASFLHSASGLSFTSLCGYPYMPSTLDLFTRELKYLGVGSTWWEIHARMAERLTQGWGDPRRGAVAYVDGSSKEVHTQLFSQATKVSQ